MKTIDLGRKNYLEVWELQKELVEKRARNEIEDTLLFVEHDPVFTAGRSSHDFKTEINVKLSHSKSFEKVPVIAIERGGKLTFHGPGQLVGYPIFKLSNHDLRFFLRSVENILMQSIHKLSELNVRPCPLSLELEPGQLQTGVWIENRKIASIGIAVKQWVSYHGFALKLYTDLDYFGAIDPCGFNPNVITTLQKEMMVPFEPMIVDAYKSVLQELFSKLSKELSGISMDSLNKTTENQLSTTLSTTY